MRSQRRLKYRQGVVWIRVRRVRVAGEDRARLRIPAINSFLLEISNSLRLVRMLRPIAGGQEVKIRATLSKEDDHEGQNSIGSARSGVVDGR